MASTLILSPNKEHNVKQLQIQNGRHVSKWPTPNYNNQCYTRLINVNGTNISMYTPSGLPFKNTMLTNQKSKMVAIFHASLLLVFATEHHENWGPF